MQNKNAKNAKKNKKYKEKFNFIIVADQLNQTELPVFCEDGVYRIAAEIYIQLPDDFRTLVPLLGSSHMAKCLLYLEGYPKGSGREDALIKI